MDNSLLQKTPRMVLRTLNTTPQNGRFPVYQRYHWGKPRILPVRFPPASCASVTRPNNRRPGSSTIALLAPPGNCLAHATMLFWPLGERRDGGQSSETGRSGPVTGLHVRFTECHEPGDPPNRFRSDHSARLPCLIWTQRPLT